MLPATVWAAAGDILDLEITVGTSEVDCEYKVLSEPEAGRNGTVQIGDGSYAAISKYSTGALVIPETVQVDEKIYDVIGIGKNAFYTAAGISGSLTIPASVTFIGEKAFNGCTGLTGLTLGSGVQTIGSYAFYNCSKLTGGLTIPDSVTSIGNYAFYSCTGLSSLSLGSAVETIGENAFGSCSSITGTLIITNSVTSIGNYAFIGCGNLTGLTLGSGVISIGSGAFMNCTKLTGNLTIPCSVTSIGSAAFKSCSGLTGNLIIPNTVNRIERETFYECSGFNGTLTIPSSVTFIGYNAFRFCSGLTGALTIPDSVTSIGDSAFSDCTALTGALTIPDSVTSIGPYAFSACSSLTGALTIGNGVTSIGYSAFLDCSALTGDLTIPNSVTSIGGNAFTRCTGLNGSLTLGTEVLSIGNQAFLNCSGLTGALTIPGKVTSIGEQAFKGCSGLDGALTIPESVTYIGDSAFFNCSNLTGTLTIPSNLTRIYDDTFHGCSGLTGALVIPETVTEIGTAAFYNCLGLNGTLTISSNVTSIGNFAFYNCSGLTGSLNIPSSVISIGDRAFVDCSSFTGTLTIPDSVTSIGPYAFLSCIGFTGSLTIPDSVTSLGSAAFAECSGFDGTLTIGSGITQLEDHAFNNCSGFVGLTLGTEIETISYFAFNGCNALTGALTIPDSVTSIGDYAFYDTLLDCVSMKSITAPTVASHSFTGTYPIFYPATGTGYNVNPWNGYYGARLYPDTYTQNAKPNASFTATGSDSGTLSNVDTTMKYSVDGGSIWTDIAGTSMNISGVTPDNGVKVYRPGNGTNTVQSPIQSILITKASAPTTVTKSDCTTLSNNDGRLFWVTSEMEHKLNSSLEWTAGNGSTVTGLRNGIYNVRIKPNGTMLASESQNLTINEFVGTQEEQPNAAFTAAGPNSGTLFNVTAAMKYSVDGGSTWTAIADTSINITGVTAEKGIKVYKPGNNIDTTDSNVQTITVTKAATPNLTPTQPAAPGGTGSIPMTAAHEYSSDNGSNWVTATGTTILTEATYLVRVKANGTVLASDNQTITLVAAASPLSGVVTIDNTAPRIGDVLNGSLAGGNNTGILTYVWKAAGAEAGTGASYTVRLADLGKEITLEISSNVETGTRISAETAGVLKKAAPAAPAAPTLASKTHNSVTLSANAAYEFSKDGTAWQISNVFDSLAANTAYTFYQRIAATSDTDGSASSLGFAVTTNAASLTGTATIDNTVPRIGDVLNGSLAGGNNTGVLIYSWKAAGTEVGAGASYTVKLADLGKNITLEISSNVETGTRISAETAAVLKQSAFGSPAKPTLVSKTHSTVTLTANAACEFSKDGIA